jgi:hypothetical protein
VAYETRYEAPGQRYDPYPSGDYAPPKPLIPPVSPPPPPLPPASFRAADTQPQEIPGLAYTRAEARREEQAVVATRNGALLRMREMNTRHGMHAFDLRNGSDALGAHAVAFLFRDIDGAVRAATRLFRDDTEVRDLPGLLWTLAKIAKQYVERGGFDPRTAMAHRADQMSHQAQYVGVGVSSLDTLAGEWAEIRPRVTSALQVAGSSYIQLVDSTRMILDRGGQYGIAGDTYSSHPLEAGNSFGYTSFRSLHSRPGGSNEDIWRALEALHQQVWHGSDLLGQRVVRRRR